MEGEKIEVYTYKDYEKCEKHEINQEIIRKEYETKASNYIEKTVQNEHDKKYKRRGR